MTRELARHARFFRVQIVSVVHFYPRLQFRIDARQKRSVAWPGGRGEGRTNGWTNKVTSRKKEKDPGRDFASLLLAGAAELGGVGWDIHNGPATEPRLDQGGYEST